MVKPLSRSRPKIRRCLRLMLASTLLAVEAKKPIAVAAQISAKYQVKSAGQGRNLLNFFRVGVNIELLGGKGWRSCITSSRLRTYNRKPG